MGVLHVRAENEGGCWERNWSSVEVLPRGARKAGHTGSQAGIGSRIEGCAEEQAVHPTSLQPGPCPKQPGMKGMEVSTGVTAETSSQAKAQRVS